MTCETDPWTCLTCEPGYSVDANDACVTDCGADEFWDTSLATPACASCDSSCSGCEDFDTNCILCAATYFRVPDADPPCVSACPAATVALNYCESSPYLCIVAGVGCVDATCDENCGVCADATACAASTLTGGCTVTGAGCVGKTCDNDCPTCADS